MYTIGGCAGVGGRHCAMGSAEAKTQDFGATLWRCWGAARAPSHSTHRSRYKKTIAAVPSKAARSPLPVSFTEMTGSATTTSWTYNVSCQDAELCQHQSGFRWRFPRSSLSSRPSASVSHTMRTQGPGCCTPTLHLVGCLRTRIGHCCAQPALVNGRRSTHKVALPTPRDCVF